MLTVFGKHCCQKALIRAMNSVLSYHWFWLPGLMHNFSKRFLRMSGLLS